jgi:membrane associated rhomboid family serine protease
MSPPHGGLFCPGVDLTKAPKRSPLPRILPVNRALIAINVVVFVVQEWLGRPYSSLITVLFALWPPQAAQFNLEFHWWQVLTYGFLHGTWLHLFANMFGLLMFGSYIERWLGSRRFLVYYLLCVVGAALMHMYVVSAMGLPPSQMVGASGGIYGLLLAYAMAFPKRKVFLAFPPMILPAWLLVTLYGIFELVMGVTQTASGVAHFAHLGGMATGFVIICCWRAQRRALRLTRRSQMKK